MNTNLKKLTLTAMFLALGIVLPFLTGQIPQIGSMLLPMHIPVFLCALICGWQWATPMSFLLPLLRSVIFGMPPLYPSAVAMAFELSAYAFVAGFLFALFKKHNFLTIYASLISAMLAGRALWGCVMLVLMGIKGNSFTFSAFLAGAFTKAFPGIILQLVLIPPLIFFLEKVGFIPIRDSRGRRAS